MYKAMKTPSSNADTWGLGVGHYQRPNLPPRWIVCDAKEFERVWLPKFENKQLPPCSDEEWSKIKRMLHMNGPE